MVWDESIRQGTKNGKQNSQKELVEKKMTVKQLITMFFEQLEVCIPHYQEICWMRHMQKTDFTLLRKDTLLIFTDFAAVMALRAFQVKNSAIDGHAINDNFVVIYNQRIVKVKEKDSKTENNMEIFNVDVHHFFAETLSKGKKNDHAMHHVSLDALIKHYQTIFPMVTGEELKHVKVWTDNAPHQYTAVVRTSLRC